MEKLFKDVKSLVLLVVSVLFVKCACGFVPFNVNGITNNLAVSQNSNQSSENNNNLTSKVAITQDEDAVNNQTEATPNSIGSAVITDFDIDFDEGRGRKRKNKKAPRMKRLLYPLMIGLFTAKAIILPLILKSLTLLSSASFFFSKMSFITSVILGLKWFLSGTQLATKAENPRVEIVHLPVNKVKFNDWDREIGEKFAISNDHDQYYPIEVDNKKTQYAPYA